MSTVIDALNKRMKISGNLQKISSVRRMLATRQAEIEKCAQHLPVIEAYLEKQGLGLGSLYETLGRLGEKGLERPHVANAIGAGAVGAGLGGLEQGVQDDGSVLKGMAAGAGIGAGAMGGGQAASRLLLKSKRIAQAVKDLKFYTDEGSTGALTLGEKAMGHLGRGATAVAGFNPMKRITEPMSRLGYPAIRREGRALEAAREAGGEIE